MIARLLCIVLLCLLVPTVASASLSQEESEHARSAYMFIERKNWDDAMLHAKRSGDEALFTLAEWLMLQDTSSGASFADITRFMKEHPDWPDQKRLRIRAEQSIRDSGLSASDIIAWFGSDEPITGVGKIALANALMDSKNPPLDRITTLIRSAWTEGTFDESQEKSILATHGGLLRDKEHAARADRMVWEENLSAAKRMLPRLNAAHQALIQARIALIDDKKNAPALVAKVSGALKKDPGLMFDRIRYRARRDDDKGVRELLLAAPANVPFAEKWWRYRERQVREAVDERNYTLAAKLLSNHGQSEPAPLAEALWITGWLKLEFLNQPKEAYQLFYRMYNTVRYPVSRARAAYWAARAAEKSGDKESANNWYNTGASYPTTFYGQLAAYKHFGTAPLHILAEPSGGESFNSSLVVRAIKVSVQFDARALANRLMNHLIENSDNTDKAIFAARLGQQIDLPYLSVRGAKKALQRNIVMIEAGYPRPKTDKNWPIERALTLAITRQESEFDPFARSPAGALGMMQLLPGTAKETAGKADLDYSKDNLFNPNYNMELGSHYVSRMVGSYNGSYIMAIAAYNAGPGNVRKWINQFGTPGNSVDSAVNWMEKIPFDETRNYVHRVMENLQVYRHIEADGGSAKLTIGDDLVR